MNSSNNSSFVEKLKVEAVPLLLSAFHVPIDNVTARFALEFYIAGLVCEKEIAINATIATIPQTTIFLIFFFTFFYYHNLTLYYLIL
mgnify:CR=1 FL=1